MPAPDFPPIENFNRKLRIESHTSSEVSECTSKSARELTSSREARDGGAKERAVMAAAAQAKDEDAHKRREKL